MSVCWGVPPSATPWKSAPVRRTETNWSIVSFRPVAGSGVRLRDWTGPNETPPLRNLPWLLVTARAVGQRVHDVAPVTDHLDLIGRQPCRRHGDRGDAEPMLGLVRDQNHGGSGLACRPGRSSLAGGTDRAGVPAAPAVPEAPAVPDAPAVPAAPVLPAGPASPVHAAANAAAIMNKPPTPATQSRRSIIA